MASSMLCSRPDHKIGAIPPPAEWVARKHRKRDAIEKADEHRTEKVNNRCNDQSVPMKDGDLLDGASGREKSTGQKLIGYTSMAARNP